MALPRSQRSLVALRPRLPRRALPWYAAALALLVVTVVTVSSTLDRAATAEAAYGETVAVVVATARVEPGEVVDAEVAGTSDMPLALVPEGALVGEPPGRVALVELSPGEVVLTRRVAGSGSRGPAARLDEGQRAIPVPLAVPGLPLEAGDRVDVIAGGAPGGGPDGDLPVAGSSSRLLVADAEVLHRAEDVVVLAVPSSDAVSLASALTVGPVVAVLRPPG